MKRRIKLIFLFLIMFAGRGIFAQQMNIIDDLETRNSATQGKIVIESDPAITASIGTPMPGVIEGVDSVKMNGYRIQVFMSSTPKVAREEAFGKKVKLQEKFPELDAYVIYDTPIWKLLVGDFLTKEEAVVYEQKIKKAFPDFGKEVYSIPSEIKAPVVSNSE